MFKMVLLKKIDKNSIFFNCHSSSQTFEANVLKTIEKKGTRVTSFRVQTLTLSSLIIYINFKLNFTYST